MNSLASLAGAIDAMVERPGGMYGTFEDIPLISQKGHARRVEILDSLAIGDVRQMSVVDFGMGAWGFGSVFNKLQHCKLAIGMDISPAALEQSRNLAAQTKAPYQPHFQTFQSDGAHVPCAPESIDLFFAGESIEHVRFPPRFLSEIHRVLKPNGQLIVTTPNRHALKYRQQGEEYCTSPEHFWLFDWQELRETLQEFFIIKSAYGFNGSFGSLEEDRAQRDDTVCEDWSRAFLHSPGDATGMIVHLTKRSDVSHCYEIHDLPAQDISVQMPGEMLSLEFGLKGQLLETPSSSVTITRPPSDGIVCRFWCHRWSGIAAINTGHSTDRLDLYAYEPGWKQWVNGEPTYAQEVIKISPTGIKNNHAHSTQVIFFEAFTWSRAPVPRALPPRVPLQQTGYGFARYDLFVATTVFLWFTENEGNLSGPWQPVGGRKSWDGSVDFWRRQIRQIMMANIDAIYVHCIEKAFIGQRDTFFRAYAQLRAEGWDVPKIAPFLDPFYLWRESPIDGATPEGKAAFVAPLIDFYHHYFSINTDPQAATFLLTVDHRLMVTTWWVAGLVRNVDKLTRDDVVGPLRKQFAKQIPQLAYGIYVGSAALIDPDVPFSDERMVMFAGYTYALHSVHDTVDVWHVQAGYWDQNIRKPGYLLPRAGGDNYRSAWEIVCANIPGVHRVYIESWNEYDEGSGIYASEPSSVLVNEAMHKNSDVFSHSGDPYEYIRTTAAGAAKINKRPMFAAEVVAAVGTFSPEKPWSITAWLKNAGNECWTRQSGIRVCAVGGQLLVHEPLYNGANSGPFDDIGIVRGQVSVVQIPMPAMKTCPEIDIFVQMPTAATSPRYRLTR